jgi:acetyl esterase/lipase
VLTRPVDFDPARKYPLLVVIHGGPTGISIPLRLGYYERRYYPIQQWAAKGAFILQPNYRGSAGYGEAFRRLNVRNLGLGDYDDVISGVDALIAQGWVDPDQVGAMGWSQGGYISAFIATYSDRFKAVSVGAGISNWLTYYVNTDIHPFTRQYLEATPWDDPDIYARTSPMTYIKQAQTPTLIQHGEFDRRVPIPNAYELYQGLQDMGVEVKLVVYKGMGHGISKPRLTRQAMEENFNWFNRWLWGETPTPIEAGRCYIALASGDQPDRSGDLPALERFADPLIRDVHHWAQRDGAAFRLLSPQCGLLAADAATPRHDALLTVAAVADLAGRIADQLRAAGYKQLTFYSAKPADQPSVLIALGCLHVAAGSIGGITVDHQVITGKGP